MLIGRVPSRIDFTGGYTDISPFIDDYRGYSVNISVSLYTWAKLLILPSKNSRIISHDLNKEVVLPSYKDITFDGTMDIAKVVFQYFKAENLELTTWSNIPIASGMGSSGAYATLLVGMLDSLTNNQMSKIEIAGLAGKLQRKVGIVGGIQDELASMLGSCHIFSFTRTDVEVEKIDLSQTFIDELTQRLVLVNIKGLRTPEILVHNITQKYTAKDVNLISTLHSLNRLAYNIKEALQSESIPDLINLVKEVRVYQKQIHPLITSSFVEAIFDLAFENGAVAGKGLGGAGGGGCVLFFCEPNSKARLAKAFSEKGLSVIPISLNVSGFQVELKT